MNDLALFNDLFNDFGDDGYTMPAFSYKKMFHMPKVDVKENKENYTLTMDMPGKTDKDVDIELNQNVLTVSSFKRSFTLPDDVDSEKLTANVKNGVLTVSMPRKALAQPKHIAITNA